MISFDPCNTLTSRYFHFPHFADDSKDCTQGHTAMEAGFGILVADLIFNKHINDRVSFWKGSGEKKDI